MDINFIGLILASIMASAVPLILASCGELITERSGVLNLGVEGMMIIGAISGFALMTVTGNLFIAVIGAMLAGLLISSIFALFDPNINYKSRGNWLGADYIWYRNFSNDRKELCWYSWKGISCFT